MNHDDWNLVVLAAAAVTCAIALIVAIKGCN